MPYWRYGYPCPGASESGLGMHPVAEPVPGRWRTLDKSGSSPRHVGCIRNDPICPERSLELHWVNAYPDSL